MTDPHRLVDELVTELADWLPSQRWFAGKDRPISAVRPLGLTVLLDGDPLLLHVIVEVEQGDRTEPYQLLIGRRSHPPDVAASVWIGSDNCYEASNDADLTAVLLDRLVSGEGVGTLRFEREPDAELTGDLRARPITSEQSNTSLVYGSQYILKLFRKLSPGANKDLLLHRALQGAGCEHIARTLGSITGELAGEPTTIAMMQQFLPDAVDGWAMATTSVRDLMADPELRPEDLGGDFAGEADRLGQAVASVHGDLARALGTEPVDEHELERTVKAMVERLDTVAAQVPELAEHVPALRAVFEKIRDTASANPISMQYVHGDLHLGQVLRTVNGWLLLDFEGEPAVPVEERHALRSPLRDVAGMLRSFDYAAQQLLVGQAADPLLTERAMEWADRNRVAFCEGYAKASGIGDPRDHPELLRAFELDKAVYEVAYEHANRPDWLTVPLSSIARITHGGE
ncbi:maltokinase N-terminal cap-like domain-containing protein [Amycolatopsis sp. H20-H5]|uniref:maltokinase N-terminal cap-like domain-containing protein n=1 Tax=Amycolatopsis sp. H20-H5 TaxID=3046309 RepID=UPI002DB61873|nr:aminoglycoside phosphotransferase [Amycolatopsis sp. H20-H5]MEC3974223.1 aminoglycoside phosphotransferase [Amycolatopsis sp. H20-H5]